MNIYILNATSTGLLSTKLLQRESNIKGMICLDWKSERKTMEYYDYELFCKKNNMDFIPVKSYNLQEKEDIEKIKCIKIDLLLVLSWQRLIPNWLIDHCRTGVVGLHGSAKGITEGRGRSPQNWAILLGEQRFSLSLFWINTDVDAGEIIDTKVFTYELIDDIEISYIKSNLLAVDMIIENLRNGKIEHHVGIKQSGDVGYLPQRIEEDGMIDWNRSCQEIYNFIRALTMPYPCAFTKLNGYSIKIIKSVFIETESVCFRGKKVGEILAILEQNHFLVKCSKGIIMVTDYINIDNVDMQEGCMFESSDFNSQINKIIERHEIKSELRLSPLMEKAKKGKK